MFKLSVITDEVSQDLDLVIEFAGRFGLDGLELRSLWDKGPFTLGKEDVKTIREKTAAAGLQVCAVSPPFFKCDIEDKTAVAEHLEGLRRCCDTAHELGARLIRGFSFWKVPGLPFERIAEQYVPVIQILEREDLTMVIEPDPSINTPNGKTVAKLLGLIGSDRAGALWDPGNILYDDAGEVPYPDGYEAVRPYLRHVHLKDAVRVDDVPSVVPVGEGQVDMAGQFRRLAADHYDGWVSLETHYRLTGEINEESMRLPGGSGFSDGGWEASADCLTRFYKLLKVWNLDDRH